MLEVGCAHGPGGEDDPGLSFVEARTHFGAWCVVSSPLILSHDTTDDSITDSIWPIISNTEAIEVNQAWAGDSGSLFLSSPTTIKFSSSSSSSNEKKSQHPLHLQKQKQQEREREEEVGVWQQWSKKLSDNSAAVLVMNNSQETQTVTINFSTIPTFSSSSFSSSEFSLRDIWNHVDVGVVSDSYTVTLQSHDSAFFKITSVVTH